MNSIYTLCTPTLYIIRDISSIFGCKRGSNISYPGGMHRWFVTEEKNGYARPPTTLDHINENSFTPSHGWEYHEILWWLQESKKFVRVGKRVSFLYDPAVAQSKVVKLPRGIQGEKSRKDTASSGKLVSTIGA